MADHAQFWRIPEYICGRYVPTEGRLEMSNVNLVLLLFGIIAIVSLIGALYVNYKDAKKKNLKKSG